MIAVVEIVQPPLEKFYGLLSDEQKAKFEVIGSQRTSESDRPKARQVHYHGRNVEGDVQNLIRHLLPF